uniref:Uncharacterized protein n=1 Tax=Lactuca sativa TaxID=4236 RepID=A0A9R1VPN3_LACSA|nr:hypothetical protein LSAT_V11C400220270 [Lactuca sativa]
MRLRKPETFVFKYSCFGSKLKKTIQTCSNNLDMILINDLFEAFFVEVFAREISSFSMARNEGDYMLVDHKHKKNFYKTTKVRVSNDFIVMVDPYNFDTFQDLIARNLDTRVVSTKPIKVIIENSREKWLVNLVDQDLSQIYVFKTFYFLKYFPT